MDEKQTSSLLKALRRSVGLSQKRVAEALGVHQTAISQWENGTTHISLDNFLRLLSLCDEQARSEALHNLLQGAGCRGHLGHRYIFCPYCGEKLDQQN